jgi:hypothetical protein
VPVFSLLGLLTFFRLLLLIAVFVFGRKIAVRRDSAVRRDKRASFRFPQITYAGYSAQLDDIESFRTRSSEMMCSICYEYMQGKDIIVVLPCNVKHVYHTNCIKKWLDTHDKCPLCNTNVIPTEDPWIYNLNSKVFNNILIYYNEFYYNQWVLRFRDSLYPLIRQIPLIFATQIQQIHSS